MAHELDELSSLLGQAVSAQNWTLATAESCTGGLLAGAITATPGSSAWFERGFVTYSNESKVELLGVAPATLTRYGAVSKEVALEMADGAIVRSHADAAIAITGIAGPDGGSADKPVGTVWLAWRQRHGNSGTQSHCFPGNRETVRQHAVTTALERLIALAKADVGLP